MYSYSVVELWITFYKSVVLLIPKQLTFPQGACIILTSKNNYALP